MNSHLFLWVPVNSSVTFFKSYFSLFFKSSLNCPIVPVYNISIRERVRQPRRTDSSSRWEKDSVHCAIDKSPGPVMEKDESSSASLWLVISARQDPSNYYGLMAAPLTKSINEGGILAALRLVNVSTFVYLTFFLSFSSSFPFPLCLLVFFSFPLIFLPLFFSPLHDCSRDRLRWI